MAKKINHRGHRGSQSVIVFLWVPLRSPWFSELIPEDTKKSRLPSTLAFESNCMAIPLEKATVQKSCVISGVSIHSHLTFCEGIVYQRLDSRKRAPG